MDRTIRPTRGAPEEIYKRGLGALKELLPVGVGYGVVLFIGDFNITEVRCRRSTLWISWHKRVLPPKVKVGATVMAYGKIVTFGNGRSLQFLDARMLKWKPGAAGKALSNLLQPFIVDPSTYLPADLIDGDDIEGLGLPQQPVRPPISQL